MLSGLKTYQAILATDADAARVRALIAYKDFLTLWKDGDPDIPIALLLPILRTLL